MSTCASLLHKLSSHEFWPLCTQYSTSRVKTQSYFKEQPVCGCEVQEMTRPIFLKSSILIFFLFLWVQFYKNTSLGFGEKFKNKLRKSQACCPAEHKNNAL